jgi:CheY-like chemotaxis protein
MDTQTRRRRILVVDDEADIRALLLATFEDAGYDVDLADDGVAALARILAHRPDLMTLDLAMPGMDGWDLVAKLATLPAPPPIVLISGVHSSPRMPGPLQPFVFAYLSKPFPVDFLLATCARILDAVEREPVRVAVERRRSVRRPVTTDVALLSADGAPVVRGHVLNLSAEGAEIDLGTPLAQDSRVALAISLPDGIEPLIVAAQVRWRYGDSLGVQFEDLSPEAVARLAGLLA